MSNLTVIQSTALATEISLAKNYAIKSNNLVNDLVSDVNTLKNEVYVNNNKLNTVISKLENLCNLLSQADISGVNADDLKYSNL